MSNPEEYVGQKFNRLTILKVFYPERSKGAPFVICECECGKEITVRFIHIRDGNYKSCGCMRNEVKMSLHLKIRKNAYWFAPIEELSRVVREAQSFADVLEFYGVNRRNSADGLISKLKLENIDFSHIPTGRGASKGKKLPQLQVPLEQILVKGTNSRNVKLKSKLLEAGLIKNECNLCGLGPFWQNQPLVIQLDHINGDKFDNRLENLRMLCPNCHTQTPTYGKPKRLLTSSDTSGAA